MTIEKETRDILGSCYVKCTCRSCVERRSAIDRVLAEHDRQETWLASFKARYSALPAMPTRQEWKAAMVATMADIEGWPEEAARGAHERPTKTPSQGD